MVKDTASDGKRLAKNTILLYGRTFLIMTISLFTSRVVLNTLGIDNYGIYNVIGGFVAMFSIAGGTLVTACQRFLTYEIGKKENAQTQKVFSAALTIHIVLAIFLLVLFETIGLWFLNVKMNIPPDRMIAANWVFQCSILAFLVNIVSSPYNALIIAHEKMSAFAYISLMDAILKLLIVYMLYITSWDRLILYAILYLGVAILDRLIYSLYCRRFSESKFVFIKDKALYKKITGFAGFTFLGSVASLLSNHGVNLILNLFYGVAINAARGIAVQVQNAVVKFVNDFMTALNPQITKSYAAGDKEKSMNLCYKGARFSFFLLMVMALPIMIRTPYILELWLKVYPDYATMFVRLTLTLSLVTLLSTPLTTEILAVGKLKLNALAIGGIRLLNLPLCYTIMNMGASPEYCYVVLIIMEILSLLARLIILKLQIRIHIINYFREVIVYVIAVLAICFFMSHLLDKIIAQTLIGLFVFGFVSVIVSIIVVYVLGLKKMEKKMIAKFVFNKIQRVYGVK